MTRHYNVMKPTSVVGSVDRGPSQHAESPFDSTVELPLSAGWYRLTISGLSDLETIELRLDFGLGFVGHHAVRAIAEGGEAELFVRLFKQLRAMQLLRSDESRTGAPASVSLDAVPLSRLWARRALEQFHLWRRAFSFGRKRSNSPHDKSRRLWGWQGLQAFPASLPAKGLSSYDLYRRITRSRMTPKPYAPLEDWLIVMDCRSAQSTADCLEALSTAAANVGAGTHLLRSGHLKLVLEQAGKPIRWIVFVEPNVVLDQDCVASFAEAASASDAAILYSDSDYQESGRRHSPELRTSFSVERLRWQDWLGGVLVFRADVLNQVSDADSVSSLARAFEPSVGSNAFAHAPKVLYSRHSSSRPNASTPPPDRGKWSGSATVIIPTRNRADLLQRCVDSIFALTMPHPPQIIIHDNGSDDPATLALLERYADRDNVRILRDEGPFNFSRINNGAAALAEGELLLFLNNDTEVVSPDWIETLGVAAAEASVGCAGPLLLRPDGKIQHAGLVTGPGGIAAHVHAGLYPEKADSAAPIVRRDVSALTGACLAIEKDKFLAAGGFDAEGLPVAFNDVDLCLRLERLGFRNVFVPEAVLTHVGSATREDDDFTTGSDRFRAEFTLMRERWGPRLDGDPFFPEQLRLTHDGPQLRLA